jgi:UPF0716 family protein affecting phage T7 exclusion
MGGFFSAIISTWLVFFIPATRKIYRQHNCFKKNIQLRKTIFYAENTIKTK